MPLAPPDRPLGQLRKLRVRQYMATKLVTFTPEMEITEAITQLVRHKFTGAPVVDGGGTLVGMLSEKDCLKVAVEATMDGVAPGLVGDYMTTKVDAVGIDADLLEVARRFIQAPYKRFPVVDAGKLVGQISRFDVLRAIAELG